MGSDIYRKIFKYGPGKIFVDNKYYRFLRISKNYLLASFLSLQSGNIFDNVKVFCVFIGHMKSGGSMLSALLDAHPNVVFSDEAKAMDYLKFGFKKDQIFNILLRNSKTESRKGRITARRLGGYSWFVPGQWQGRHQRIDVVGDCTTGATTRNLGRTPELMSNLQETMMGAQVKFIHVIRNPFDPIAVSMVRGRRSFENAAENYFSSCDLLIQLREQIESHALMPVRYDEFVKDPRGRLRAVCKFLGLDVNDEYLTACGNIIHNFDSSRNLVEWKPDWVASVNDRISKYDFLHGYTFEN